LSASLVHAWRMNVVHASRAVAAYSAALEQMRPGSRFIRVRFPTDQIRKRLGFESIALEPLFHVDSRAAVRRKLVALSDYQASSGLFPVAFRSEIPVAKQYALWDLEGSGTTTEASLREVLKDFPLRIDYVVLLGDGSPGERAQEFESVKAYLDRTLSLAYTDESKVFARVYRR
jgi:hypothetical protein